MQVNANYSTALDITRACVIFHGYRILQQHQKLILKKSCLREHRAFKKSVQIWLNVAIAIYTFAGARKNRWAGRYLTVSQFSTGLKDFLGNFISTIILTMPVSIATPERSFSCTWRVKTYLRSTMQEEKLSGLELLYAHRDKSIDTHVHIYFLGLYILECHAKTALSLRSSYYCIEVGKYNIYVKRW